MKRTQNTAAGELAAGDFATAGGSKLISLAKISVGILLLVTGSWSTQAQQVHLSVPQTGGMPGYPVITGMRPTNNGMVLTWDGPPGYYRVYEKRGTDGAWQPIGGATNLARTATITGQTSNAFFKVLGPPARYAGSSACMECHSSMGNVVSHTRHAGAFTNAAFVAWGGQTNGACLPCHTVGFGLPTGFISKEKTPLLTGVQCESCHGPAQNHAASPADPTVRPRVEIASAMCGGCHTGSHQPTYDEWKTSDHTRVFGDLNATNRLSSCGRCHSGSVRLSLLKKETPQPGDANIGIECVVCHDPHQVTGNPFQLRNPITSTNDYSLATNDVFSTAYNPNVNICGQCHNRRGESYTMTNAAPHYSAQYNLLLGTVGELKTGVGSHKAGAHGYMIEGQCVGCHMQTADAVPATNGNPALPAVTGHSFRVANSYDSCQACHPSPEALVDLTRASVTNRIAYLKFALDFWAEHKAPTALWTKYNHLAWEYTRPGPLSGGGTGPDAGEQNLIPDAIKKARFNVYLVRNEGSNGIHNPRYAISLLDSAEQFIQDALGPDYVLPPHTNF